MGITRDNGLKMLGEFMAVCRDVWWLKGAQGDFKGFLVVVV